MPYRVLQLSKFTKKFVVFQMKHKIYICVNSTYFIFSSSDNIRTSVRSRKGKFIQVSQAFFRVTLHKKTSLSVKGRKCGNYYLLNTLVVTHTFQWSEKFSLVFPKACHQTMIWRITRSKLTLALQLTFTRSKTTSNSFCHESRLYPRNIILRDYIQSSVTILSKKK